MKLAGLKWAFSCAIPLAHCTNSTLCSKNEGLEKSSGAQRRHDLSIVESWIAHAGATAKPARTALPVSLLRWEDILRGTCGKIVDEISSMFSF